MNSLISVKHLPVVSCNDDKAVLRRVSLTFNKYLIVINIIGFTALLLQNVFNLSSHSREMLPTFKSLNRCLNE